MTRHSSHEAHDHQRLLDDDRYLVGTLPVAAPEIVEHAGAYYIVTLTPELDGMQVARLEFGP